MPFQLPDLPYAKDALEPHIDARTMELHHDKHHATYVKKASDAVAGTPLENADPEDVIRRLGELPAEKQTPLRNNGGGAVNHSLFWATMAPPNQGGGGSPSGELASAIDSAFGGFDAFKEQFKAAATGRFGSGWAWLCVGPAGDLHITSTANQDNPMMPPEFGGEGGDHKPILGLDVWEHAYYLNYQNRRPDYVDGWWNVVNWPKVGELYAAATS